MTDYFALLEQPRRPWLDPEQLKQAFHTKSKRAHPDARPQSNDSAAFEGKFTELNEAYQVLQDPKRRLQHLLQLEGKAGESRFDGVPEDVGELFPRVAALTQQAGELAQKHAAATSPLSRSLMKPELLQLQSRVAGMLKAMRAESADAQTQLRRIDGQWCQDGETIWRELRELYLRFSYLSRWITQLEETQLQLSDL